MLPPPQLLLAALEALTCPLLLLDGGGRILHANAAGRRALAQPTRTGSGTAEDCAPTDVPGWRANGPDAFSSAMVPGCPLLPAALRVIKPKPVANDDWPGLPWLAREYGWSSQQLRLARLLCQGLKPGPLAVALGWSDAVTRRERRQLLRGSGLHSVRALRERLQQLPPVRMLPHLGLAT